MLEEGVGPVVHHPGHQRLHVAELTVDTKHEQHHEEDGGPDNRAGERENLDKGHYDDIGGLMTLTRSG